MKNPLRLLIALAALSLAAHAFAQDARPGDAKAGEAKAAMCIGCHGIAGYKGSFPEIYHVPMISGQNAKYIVAALTEYKKGERRHPTMRGIAASLNEQDMADLAAFYSQEYSADAPPVAVAPAAVAELLKKGNCASCHGDNFSKPIDASYPKLAGQHADYLYFALKAYQVDGNPLVGRGNAIMKGMAKPFSHAELKQIADYIGSLPGQLAVVPQSPFR